MLQVLEKFRKNPIENSNQYNSIKYIDQGLYNSLTQWCHEYRRSAYNKSSYYTSDSYENKYLKYFENFHKIYNEVYWIPLLSQHDISVYSHRYWNNLIRWESEPPSTIGLDESDGETIDEIDENEDIESMLYPPSPFPRV